MVWAGIAVYVVNVIVGLLAQFRGMRFGRFHHVLYAFVVAGAIAAAVFDFRPGLILTLAALAAFPFAKPRTVAHPTLAVVVGVGYGLAVLL